MSVDFRQKKHVLKYLRHQPGDSTAAMFSIRQVLEFKNFYIIVLVSPARPVESG